MKRFLCLAVTACVLTLTPPARAQQQVAAAPAARPASAPAAVRADAFTTTIQGNALSSTNGFLSDTNVRLRDARNGRVLTMQITDKTGLFAFRGIDPGSYIVELVSPDQTMVLAASEILNVNAGEVVSAVVKLPFKTSPFFGVLGPNGATVPSGTATAVIAEAAANSILIIAAPHTAVTACPEQVF